MSGTDQSVCWVSVLRMWAEECVGWFGTKKKIWRVSSVHFWHSRFFFFDIRGYRDSFPTSMKVSRATTHPAVQGYFEVGARLVDKRTTESVWVSFCYESAAHTGLHSCFRESWKTQVVLLTSKVLTSSFSLKFLTVCWDINGTHIEIEENWYT